MSIHIEKMRQNSLTVQQIICQNEGLRIPLKAGIYQKHNPMARPSMGICNRQRILYLYLNEDMAYRRTHLHGSATLADDRKDTVHICHNAAGKQCYVVGLKQRGRQRG